MSRWPLPRLSNKHKFFGKLLIFSSVFHLVLCFTLFFLYGDSISQCNVSVSTLPSEVIVKLLPFAGKKSVQKSLPTHTRTTLKARTSMGKKNLPSVKKTQKQKVVHKKELEKQKVPHTKKESVQKSVQKSPVQKPVQAEEKPIKRFEQQVPKNEEVRYVGAKEFDEALLEQVLQEAIACVWAPPAGMETTLVSVVSLTIGWDGKIAEARVEQQSGVLVYDLAVEQAIAEFVPPRQSWGKVVRLAFKP